MTTNEFTIKDNFDVVSHINSIPNKLFDDGFRFLSFDVKSLFTNIPQTKTINIILQRIYHSKLITTNLSRRSLIFSVNGNYYGVSMGSP